MTRDGLHRWLVGAGTKLLVVALAGCTPAAPTAELCGPAGTHASGEPAGPIEPGEPSEPSGPSEPGRRPALDLTVPGCVAWSARTHHFVCIGLRATPPLEGVSDLTSDAMDHTLALVQRLGADVELGLVDVDPEIDEDEDADESPWLATIDLTLTDASARKQLAGLELLLDARGFDVPLVETLVLEPANPDDPSTGMQAARSESTGREFIYRYDLHEGDASFEYRGELAVRCGPKQAPRVVYDDLGGPFARVGIAEGGRWAVVSIEHQDGGEGYVDAVWVHRAFAVDELCAAAK